jgi:hypothetical protein
MNDTPKKRGPGNPHFGTKWKNEPIGDIPLKHKLGVHVNDKMKADIQDLAKRNNTNMADIIRKAIQAYIDSENQDK